ncbi:MAG: hypothetical protein WA594_20640 [Candidatus Sulfotelmatobacter sp.]
MNLAVQIVRFVGWEPQPGLVACEFVDAADRLHVIIDKIPIFSTLALDERSPYPMSGFLRCELVDHFQDSRGRELLRISTGGDSVESTNGVSEFIVLPSQVVADN